MSSESHEDDDDVLLLSITQQNPRKTAEKSISEHLRLVIISKISHGKTGTVFKAQNKDTLIEYALNDRDQRIASIITEIMLQICENTF